MNRIPSARGRSCTLWLLVLTIIGYPIAGLVSSAFDLDSRTTSVPLRVVVLVLCLWVVVRARRGSAGRLDLLLVGFFFLYFLRLVWDMAVASVPGADDALVFFLLTVMFPCAALWAGAGDIDDRAAARLMLGVGSLICVAAVAMHLLGVGSTRSLTEVTGRLSYEALNPISIGHAATSTLLAVLALSQTRRRSIDFVLMVGGAVIAIVTLGLAAARGPVLSLAAAAVMYAAVTRRWHWLVPMFLASIFVLADPQTPIWERFVEVQDDQSSTERLVLQGSAIASFLASPFFGSAFVEPLELTYPHNLFIETAMAMGFVGLVLLLPMLFRCYRSALSECREGRMLLPMLFVQYFIGAQLSGAIWGNAALWATGTILLARASQVRMLRRRAGSARPLVGQPAEAG